MSTSTSKISDGNIPEDRGVGLPKRGDVFHCHGCKMELEITKECGCSDPSKVHFHCCGMEMHKKTADEL